MEVHNVRVRALQWHSSVPNIINRMMVDCTKRTFTQIIPASVALLVNLTFASGKIVRHSLSYDKQLKSDYHGFLYTDTSTRSSTVLLYSNFDL
jgi:hypothetical protein